MMDAGGLKFIGQPASSSPFYDSCDILQAIMISILFFR
ncbi:hypothetical protein AB434_2005 [Heyndrickxia coagulans]|uniref:Uncharacterized protein n=1 Tax=Heyndrickxia coagulans TaxID=1398 RepID=A0AAN0WDD4_HEYCO|nr:hypothetical protein SB48_HM08orf05302 [Heyndrickxia coagulans]AKN54410.1 hypothetical protein AB434_2005 [Heyndrickxia coagulans]